MSGRRASFNDFRESDEVEDTQARTASGFRLPQESGQDLTRSMTPHLDERVPLLKMRTTSRQYGDEGAATSSVFLTGMKAAADVFVSRDAHDTFVFDHNGKMICYDHESLTSIKAFTLLFRSTLTHRPVLYTALTTCLVAVISAICIATLVPWASRLNTKRFSYFCTFLKVFISFMLGLYIQQAFKRWWDAVSTYEKFHISIRQLVYMLHSIRCHHETRQILEQYCLASSYILALEVNHAQSNHENSGEQLLRRLSWLQKQGFLIPEEVQHLERMSTVSVLATTRSIWSWIGELLCHVRSQEGNALAPPLQVRLWSLCQACIGEIESLKLNLTMQVPFSYAHLLALLVHVNNMLMGLTCGLSLGSAVAEVYQRRQQMDGKIPTARSYSENVREFYEAIQVTGVQLLILIIEPVLYMSFLHIAHMLCYPFGKESYHVPLETFVARLHQEFHSMTENRNFFRDTLANKRQQNEFGQDSRERYRKKDDIEEGELDGDDDGGD